MFIVGIFVILQMIYNPSLKLNVKAQNVFANVRCFFGDKMKASFGMLGWRGNKMDLRNLVPIRENEISAEMINEIFIELEDVKK